jgi:hypothetical protein
MKHLPESIRSIDSMLNMLDCLPSLALLEVPATRQVYLNAACRKFTSIAESMLSQQSFERLIPPADLMVR